MARRHREERQYAFGGIWRGKGNLLNALRSTLAARQAQDKAALKERQRLDREVSTERYPQWPAFEDWLRERKSPGLADKWRFRDRTPAGIVGDRDDPTQPRDIRAFVGEARRWEVLCRRVGWPGKEPRSAIGLVGARGFEPPTFRSRTERATRLRHAPPTFPEAIRNAKI